MRKNIKSFLIKSRNEMPVYMPNFIHIQQIHLLDLQSPKKRSSHRIDHIHQVFIFCPLEQIQVRYRILPGNNSMAFCYRERR